jgi:hypothetical protein
MEAVPKTPLCRHKLAFVVKPITYIQDSHFVEPEGRRRRAKDRNAMAKRTEKVMRVAVSFLSDLPYSAGH